MQLLHLYGVMGLTMVLSVTMQCGDICANLRSDDFELVSRGCKRLKASRIAGFGALSKAFGPEVSEYEIASAVWGVFSSLVLFSIQPYLFWQTSMYMAQGGRSLTTGVSLVLGAVMACKQLWSSGFALRPRYNGYIRSNHTLLLRCTFVGLMTTIWAVSAAIAVLLVVRGVMAHVCQGEWGIQSGCVQSVSA